MTQKYRYDELEGTPRIRAEEAVFRKFWDSPDGYWFRDAELDNYMFNFLESTGLEKYQDLCQWEVYNEMESRGASDPVAKVTYKVNYPDGAIDDETVANRWRGFNQLLMDLSEDTLREFVYDDTDSNGVFINVIDEDAVEEALDKVLRRVQFLYFNWIDLQDWALSYLNDEAGECHFEDIWFDEEGNIIDE